MSDHRTIMVQTMSPFKTARCDSSVIYPGQIVTRTDDVADSFALLSAATTHSQAPGCLVAVEDTLQGKTITDTYTVGNQMRAVSFQRGDIAKLRLATSQTITKGEYLMLGSGGNVVAYDEPSDDSFNPIIGQALEAVTTTSANALILVEIA